MSTVTPSPTKHLPRVLLAVSVALLGSAGAVNCVSNDTTPADGGTEGGVDADLTGTEGHACFANNTCLNGLTCVSKVCVNLSTDSGADAPVTDAPADAPVDAPADAPADVVVDTGSDAAVVQPILHWTLDNNSNNTGTVANYPLVLNGTVTYVTGKFGQAAQFASGSYGVVTGSARAVLGVSAQYTIAFWINATVTPNTGNSFFDFENRTNSPYGGIQLGFGTSSQFSLCVSTTTASYLGGSCSLFNAPAANAWHHVILRYAGTGTGSGQGAGVDVYEDDVVVKNIPNDSNNNPVFNQSMSDTLYIGTSGMTLDDIRIYNTTFTAQEQCTQVIGGTWSGSCTLP